MINKEHEQDKECTWIPIYKHSNPNYKFGYKCSECKKKVRNKDRDFNFCPRCGCKMKEDKDA